MFFFLFLFLFFKWHSKKLNSNKRPTPLWTQWKQRRNNWNRFWKHTVCCHQKNKNVNLTRPVWFDFWLPGDIQQFALPIELLFVLHDEFPKSCRQSSRQVPLFLDAPVCLYIAEMTFPPFSFFVVGKNVMRIIALYWIGVWHLLLKKLSIRYIKSIRPFLKASQCLVHGQWRIIWVLCCSCCQIQTGWPCLKTFNLRLINP